MHSQQIDRLLGAMNVRPGFALHILTNHFNSIGCQVCNDVLFGRQAEAELAEPQNVAEIGEAAKARFDELTTGENPYPYEWRSFYNGYLEGAFGRRAESVPVEVRQAGVAEHGPSAEADVQSVGGELLGLPVEDQVRLYLKSGGSMAGAEALRAKLNTTNLDDLLKRLDKLELFTYGTFLGVSLAQVKTMIREWAAEQKEKS